jgi:microcystin degradation protein MlrC
MQAPLVSLEEAVRQAKEITGGTVIFVDAADAPSSGASGDSNAILRALIDGGYTGSTLIPIVDAPAVEAAFESGIGGAVETTLGGTLDPVRFTPLPVRAKVRLLSDGRFVNESHGTEWYAGNTSVLEIDNHTVVATSRAVSLYDRSLFLAHGQDPHRFDAPGSTSANLPYLGHTVCHRPMYPMEPETTFTPEVLIFRRAGGAA